MGARVKRHLPGAFMLHGGFHVTSSPEQCLARDGVDVACVGEGDHAVLEFVEALATGADHRAIPNLWVKDADGTITRPPNSPVQTCYGCHDEGRPVLEEFEAGVERAARRVVELGPDVVLFPSEINSFDW